MSIEKPYEPSEEEIKKAKDMALDTEKGVAEDIMADESMKEEREMSSERWPTARSCLAFLSCSTEKW